MLFQHCHRLGENVWRLGALLRREQRYPEGGDLLKLQGGHPALDTGSGTRAPWTHILENTWYLLLTL
jgi:hypothetical protein